MIIVIFCGGSGTRLWPLSTHHNPKQLINIVDDMSSLQAAYKRARLITDKVYLLPESRLVQSIKNQLPELTDDQIINEPGLRGTANCLLAAIDKIARQDEINEPVAFIHADHFIRDTKGFKRSLEVAAEVSTKTNRLTLIGIEPTYAATGFGYIKKDQAINGVTNAYDVAEFKEKPDYHTASAFFASGEYLWNCGYFVASVSTFVSVMSKSAPELFGSYERLKQVPEVGSDEYTDTYLSLESDAIDYALIEKVDDLVVVPANFDWADIGSFNDAHSVSQLDVNANYVKGDVYAVDLENSYVRNDTETPLAVIGLDNVVVVNTVNGLLVARKDLSHKVGDIAKKIQANETQQ
ncbi:MAG: sugar phosphate nucleotidyltransferase [Patescibacteria group bacterium]